MKMIKREVREIEILPLEVLKEKRDRTSIYRAWWEIEKYSLCRGFW